MKIKEEDLLTVIPKLNYVLGYTYGVYLLYLVKHAKEPIDLDFKRLSVELGLNKISLFNAHKDLTNMELLYYSYSTEHCNDRASVLCFKVQVNYKYAIKLITKIMQIPLENLTECIRKEQRIHLVKKLLEL